jgi:hypothetical protein
MIRPSVVDYYYEPYVPDVCLQPFAVIESFQRLSEERFLSASAEMQITNSVTIEENKSRADHVFSRTDAISGFASALFSSFTGGGPSTATSMSLSGNQSSQRPRPHHKGKDDDTRAGAGGLSLFVQ